MQRSQPPSPSQGHDSILDRAERRRGAVSSKMCQVGEVLVGVGGGEWDEEEGSKKVSGEVGESLHLTWRGVGSRTDWIVCWAA